MEACNKSDRCGLYQVDGEREEEPVDIRTELDRLVRVHGPELLQFAYQLTHSRAAAQDLVQDSLVKVLKAGTSKPLDLDNGMAYMIRVMSNAWLRAHRTRKPWVGSIEDDFVDVVSPDDTDSVVNRHLLWQLLGALPERVRLVMVLRYFSGTPDAEIAEIIGVTPVAVRTIVSRALEKLRNSQTESVRPTS